MAGEVKIAIVGDAAQLRRVLADVSDDLDRQGRKTEETGRKMQVAGAVSMAAGGAMFVAMNRAANTASDLNEAVNQTDVVFGEAADSVAQFAQNATAIGQSERAAREAAGQFGLMFRNIGIANTESAQMSINLTQLASDAASFKNTSPEEAVQAFGAAMRGEMEPLRRYGINLDDASLKQKALELGLYDGSGALDQSAKMQAAYNLILEKGSSFAGDFTNTSDSLANQQRISAAETENATAKMGQGFVPVIQRAQAVVQGASRLFGELNDATGGMAANATIAAASVLVLGGALTSAVGTAVRMRDTWDTLTRTMSAARAAIVANQAAITAVGLGLGVATAAVAAAVIAWQRYSATKAEARRVTDAMVDALRREAGGLDGATEAVIRNELANSRAARTIREHELNVSNLVAAIRGEGRTLEVLDDHLSQIATSTNVVNASRRSASQILRENHVEVTANTRALVDLLDSQSLTTNQTAALVNELDGLSDRFDESTEKAKDQAAITRDNAQAQDVLVTAVAGGVIWQEDLKDAVGAANDALRDQFGIIESVPEAIDDYTAAQERLTEAVEKNRGTVQGNSEAARDARSAWRAYVDEVQTVITSTDKSGASFDDVKQTTVFLTNALRDNAAAYGVNKDEVDKLVAALDEYLIRAWQARNLPPSILNAGVGENAIPGSHSGSVVGVDRPEMFNRPNGPLPDERLRLLKKGQMVLTEGQQALIGDMLNTPQQVAVASPQPVASNVVTVNVNVSGGLGGPERIGAATADAVRRELAVLLRGAVA